ncbi:MAG: hypothetical protein WCH32_13955 [Pseudomonadota bacterium]
MTIPTLRAASALASVRYQFGRIAAQLNLYAAASGPAAAEASLRLGKRL